MGASSSEAESESVSISAVGIVACGRDPLRGVPLSAGIMDADRSGIEGGTAMVSGGCILNGLTPLGYPDTGADAT